MSNDNTTTNIPAQQLAATGIVLTFDAADEPRSEQRRSAFKKLVELLLTAADQEIFKKHHDDDKMNKIVAEKKIEKNDDDGVQLLQDGIVLEAKLDGRGALNTLVAFSRSMFEVRTIPKPVFWQTCKNYTSAVKTWFDEEANIQVNAMAYKRCRAKSLNCYIKLAVELGTN